MSAQIWTLLALIRWTTQFFEEHGLPTARLDAELLLAHVLSMRRLDLYLAFDQPVADEDRARFREVVRRRAKERVPVAYLTGSREFWSLDFRVSEDVLIPRPETETLVRVALAKKPERVLELGVGSGCVSAALASELAGAQITGIERCPKALDAARANLEALGLLDRVTLAQGEVLDCVEGSFDLIVSNPPYVPSAEIDGLAPELAHEPRGALDGGPEGLDVIRELIAQAPERLARPGWLALEVGEGQAPVVEELLRAAGAADVEIAKDLAGIERVVCARFGEGA